MDKTKQKIQELVPEIMEAHFGCEVECEENPNMYIVAVKEYGANHKNFLRCDFSDTKYRNSIYNGYPVEVPMICDYERYIALVLESVSKAECHQNNAGQVIKCKILGRPIQLADVLRAISKTDEPVMIDQSGMFQHLTLEGIRTYNWNLTTDYDGQSQETKDFIGKLLSV